MSITGGAGEEIAGPACVPTRYGLASVAEFEERTEPHWAAGFYHEQLSCDALQSISLTCATLGEAKDSADSGLSFPTGDPFALVAPFECSTGGLLLSRAWDLAGERLDRSEGRSLETVYWTGRDSAGNVVDGTLGGTAGVVDVTPGGGAVDITTGVALLEDWAGDNMPCGPVIHAQRGLGTYFAERNLVAANGNLMYMSGTGTRVALGGGYQASGPNNVAAAAGEAWMFVTGSVKVVRGAKFFTPDQGDNAAAVDRLVNDVTVFAERIYGTMSDCGIAAVRVTLSSCCP